MVIKSAQEFVRLRVSRVRDEYGRAAHECRAGWAGTCIRTRRQGSR